MRGYMQSVEVGATADTVWRALTHGPSLALWYAPESLVEPRRGGRYDVRTRLFGHRSATIDVFDAPRRLRLIFLPEPDWPRGAEAAIVEATIVEDFLLDSRGERTLLRLLGSGVPDDPAWDAAYRRLKAGWAVAFNYLERRVAAGQILGAA